ncbi:hypothetical protein EVAR_90059_1 [Eumeta japonica]|uniref:Uncharacterized protein n=1 Tax=Eumeta variegata TaxID=151549 RepID=A0A4C1WXH5_EUMVA|nr:hypothetical protein EVAR_90059_1 [Eumeta japonica]
MSRNGNATGSRATTETRSGNGIRLETYSASRFDKERWRYLYEHYSNYCPYVSDKATGANAVPGTMQAAIALALAAGTRSSRRDHSPIERIDGEWTMWGAHGRFYKE